MSTKNQHQGKLPVAAPKSPLPEEQPAAASGFPIVGIGASAGGLAAFEAFFSGMPADTDPGMAFVLIQHLDPNHKSILTEIIQRYTRMQVFEVQDGVTVKPNCVYIIPPNADLAFLNGALQLIEPVAARAQRLPIDFFFRSLAQDQHERAIGVVLSGTGSDGTLGAREIKGEGGLVLAQKPESAQYDGMPRNVIATGMADFELPPAEMPARIIAYVAAHSLNHAVGFSVSPTPPSKAEAAMKKIFVLLRAQAGHDFSQYKPSTIHRRIERRMAVHQITMMDAYVRYLQQTSAEVEALFRDLLIGVTSFFRDPEAFQALEERVIPKLFTDRPANTVIRVWVPGCSTGEEAYSLAILLQEQLETLKRGYKLQIFASDIDSRAIATARIGIYPISSTAHLSPERQSRFFIPEPSGETCRVPRNLRDLIVFSEHDVIKDPPFSKVDLISCRNLLIYMDGDLQKRLMPLFHYALNPGGFLFLGTSETPGDTPLFAPLDRKAKLYQRKESGPRTSRSFVPLPITSLSPHEIAHPPLTPAKLSPREMAEKTMLQQLVPASALVNAQGDIIYIHGRTGMYLELAPGEASINNILKTAREGLRRDLAITLHKAVATGETMCQRGLRVKTNGHFTTVNLTICPAANNPPVASLAPGLYLVILEEVAPGLEKIEAPPEHNADTPPAVATGTEHIALLTKELRAKEEYLQSSLEELETSSEELKSSNEEMQSMNEELQSSNEELETSKEELQSINEELSTVNAELQVKVADLARANNDMNNLLAGTSIGTVFVDHQLRILRFTPAASAIINLIPSDVGRPVSHLVPNLVGYNTLVADVTSVLNTLVGKAVEVQTIEGRYYTLRILPYRTLENVIEGAVMTFADITEIKAAEVEKGARAAELVIANKELAFQNEEKGKRVDEALAKANDLLRLAVVVHDAHDAITVQDMGGRTLAWNPGATRLYGWTEAEALTMNVRDRIPEPLREGALATLFKLSRAEILESYRTQRLTKTGATVEVSVISTALVNETGKPYAIATTERLKTKGEP